MTATILHDTDNSRKDYSDDAAFDTFRDDYPEQYDRMKAEVQRPATVADESWLDDDMPGYDEWTDNLKQHEPLPQPQDFARRLYDDLDVWEVPSYGRVWQTEGVYTHNGPKGSQLRRYFEDRDDAIQNLIDCVHKQLDDERAKQFDRDASLGHYGGWR